MNNRTVGAAYEQQAAVFLRAQGYRVLAHNFRSRRAEADLVAADGKYLVFVEVKARRSYTAGCGAEAVDVRKQRRIVQAAQFYLLRHHLPADTPVRFDVVSIDRGRVHLIKNAFHC